MSELKVEKRAVDAQVLFTDGSQAEGCLFLAPFSRNHEGPQTIADLMLEAGQVLPFRKAGGAFVLLGTATVAAVRLKVDPPGEEGFLERVPVSIQLLGDHRVDGDFLAEQGAGDRLSSVLDSPDEWFRVERSSSCYWILKRHLVTLEPRSS